MAWKAYKVILRLRTNLHIGHGRVGNVLHTRPYVPGRNLWGGLTERMARDFAQGRGQAIGEALYQMFSYLIHESLGFTYFFPAVYDENLNDYAMIWPWQADETYQIIDTYTSTALAPGKRAADPTTLHEVEFIAPFHKQKKLPIHLIGYIFHQESRFDQTNTEQLAWCRALPRLQLGGERNYGWGAVAVAHEPSVVTGAQLFGGHVTFDGSGKRPIVRVRNNVGSGRILAHAVDKQGKLQGPLEPLVGREYRPNVAHNFYMGQYVHYEDICFAPGSRVSAETDFSVERFGVWQRLS